MFKKKIEKDVSKKSIDEKIKNSNKSEINSNQQTPESKSVVLNDMTDVQIDRINQEDKVTKNEQVNESISLLIRSEQPKDTQSNEISESIFQTDFFDIRVEYSLYLFSKENSFRNF
jgi:hypothetical protein